jgi:hypothetical protein
MQTNYVHNLSAESQILVASKIHSIFKNLVTVMSNESNFKMNFSIINNYEVNQWHSNSDEVLSVFQNSSKWVLYKESTKAASAFSALCNALIWLPIAFMFMPGSIIFGGALLIMLLFSMLFSLPASAVQAMVSPPAIAIGYVLSLLWVLKTQTPLKDFRERKKYLSTKEIFFDFANGVLVIGEAFNHFPTKNNEISMDLKKLNCM